MPTFGALEVGPVAARLPRMRDLDTEAWELPKAEIVQLSWEVGPRTQELLPKGMHPAIPAYASLWVIRYPESPVGAFALALLRLMGRAGAHPRGFVLGGIASSEAAATALRAQWGLPVAAGQVTFQRSHDRVAVGATRDGAPVLEAALVDPDVISGGDVQYIHSVTLARAPLDGAEAPRLIQVDSHYTFHKAERGRPRCARLDADAFNAPGLVLAHPIAGSVTTCDTDLPRIRFVMDPDVWVVRSTKRIR